MDIFPLVYRCAVVVRPQQPLADWLKKVEPTFMLSLEEMRNDSPVFLVPDFEDAEDIDRALEKFIRSNYQGIFLNHLASWCLDPTTYPKITYPVFKQWFELSMHSMVFDMVNEPLDKE